MPPVILAVGSGKGGTGKTTVASLIATHLTKFFSTALLDADVSTPSLAVMFGIENEKWSFSHGALSPCRMNGIAEDTALEIFSIGQNLPHESHCAIHGGQLQRMLKEMLTTEIKWGDDVEVIVVDMPPTTSDCVQTILQTLPHAKIVPVTINTPLGVADTLKLMSLVNRLKMLHTDVVVNMVDTYVPLSEINYIEQELHLPIMFELPTFPEWFAQNAGLAMLKKPHEEFIEPIRRLV